MNTYKIEYSAFDDDSWSHRSGLTTTIEADTIDEAKIEFNKKYNSVQSGSTFYIDDVYDINKPRVRIRVMCSKTCPTCKTKYTEFEFYSYRLKHKLCTKCKEYIPDDVEAVREEEEY